MDIFDSHFYEKNKFFLTHVGMWPYQKMLPKIFFRFIIFVSLTTSLFPQVYWLCSSGNNIEEMLNCVPPLCITLMGCTQTFVYLCNEKKLKKLYDFIKNDWKIWSTGVENEIFIKFAANGKIFMIYYTGYMCMTVGTFITMSFTPIVFDILNPLNESRPKLMVYPARFPFSHEKYFDLILFHGSISALINVTILIGAEGMYLVVTQHACGLFAIISYRLNNALKINEDKKFGGKTEDELYNDISFAIERHCYAIKFAKLVNTCYSPVLFCTFGFNLISISITGLQTLMALGEWNNTIKYGVFTFSLILHIYFLSLPAQKLLDISTNVVQNAYDECWYQMPIKSRKLLSMIIMRGHIPCKLTAGKIYTVDMITFSALLKTAVSYFTVLTSMR